jgi:hypothetical protein
MSQCYVCGGPINELIIDGRDKKLKPCSVCLEISQENLDMISKKSRHPQNKILDEAIILDEDFDVEELLEIEIEKRYYRDMEDVEE